MVGKWDVNPGVGSSNDFFGEPGALMAEDEQARHLRRPLGQRHCIMGVGANHLAAGCREATGERDEVGVGDDRQT